jgi:hypothetical protein
VSLLLCAFLAACSDLSTLTVENRTTVPVVFDSGVVGPCSTGHFIWRGPWVDTDGDPAASIPPDAVPIRVDTPAAEPGLHVVDVVSTSGTHSYQSGAVPPLPACGGVPPSGS